MINETENNDLGSLSQGWSERVKELRRMANAPDASGFVAPGSPDDELFAGAVCESLTVQDIFSGDADFYTSMGDSRPTGSVPPLAAAPAVKGTSSSLMLKILMGTVIGIGLLALFSGVRVHYSSLPFIGLSPKGESLQVQAVTAEPSPSPQNQEPEVSLRPNQPVSLKAAQDYYREGKYSEADWVYQRLIENLPQTADEGPSRDFLRLNMALCQQESGRGEQSADLLRTVSQSRFPVVAIFANYYLCVFERSQKQFSEVRTRAYQAIGLLDTIDRDAAWSQEIRRNCYFLAAEAVTREALSLADADTALPLKLWPPFEIENAPLAELNEGDLQDVLIAGSDVLKKASLSPKIQADNGDGESLWTVTCNGASVQELLGRFSANAGYDVRWATNSNRDVFKGRSVSLYLNEMNDRQFMTVAAGCAGLLAGFGEDKAVTICEPTEYSSVLEQVSVLTAEAISCWQTYLLMFNGDGYLPNAHFALGALNAQQGLTAEALAAYKIVSGRYSSPALGPGALTCSAKLKTDLHDYQGGYDDLKEAVEQYPNHDQIDETYLLLAAAADRIGHEDEAAKLYSKVYYLNRSLESQAAAALAAGTLFFENHSYADAEKWLSQYINLVESKKGPDLYQACLLLGKSWILSGNYKSGCDSLRVALSGRLSQQDYVETLMALVEGYMKQECFIEAIQVLSDASSRQLSQTESVELLLLKSQALRGMGLSEEAVKLLMSERAYVIDDVLKTRIGLHLSECYIEQGRFNLAYKELTMLLEGVDSGPLAHETAFMLVKVCRQLGMDSQVLSVGLQLLEMHPSRAIEQETLELLATVYHKQQNYDRAALALMGQWE
jgi:tetratricopeptide (TPR) repeat protein